MVAQKERYAYMEYLRVISAFAVIVIHVSGQNWFKIDIGSFDWTVQTVFNLIARFGVCVFCMITGALLLHPGREITLKDVFHRYVKRILVCYVAWVILYDILYTVMDEGDLQYFILHLFQQPKHIWYLLMLISMYLVTPMMRRIAVDRKLTLYMIWLLIGGGMLFDTLPGITGFYKELAGESFGYSVWKAFLGTAGDLNHGFIPGYLGLFLLGHYVHEYGLGKWHKTLTFAALPALLLSALLTLWISKATGRYVYTLMLETNPLVVLGSVGLFAWMKGPQDAPRRYDAGSRFTKAVLWISANSFGLYLVHLALLDCAEHYLNFNVASYPAILSVPVNSLLLFGLSLILAAGLKKVPLVKRIVS